MTTDHDNAIQTFTQQYEKALANRVVQNFLHSEEYYDLFVAAIRDPTPKNRQRLDQAFRQFYTEIRLLKYISTWLWRYTRDYNAKKKREYEHYLLIVDQPKGNEPDALTYGDHLASEVSDTFMEVMEQANNLLEHIGNVHLYHCLQQLTEKQRMTLQLYYLSNFTPREIASMSGISQQAVTKTLRVSIKKLRTCIEKRGTNGLG